MPSDRAVAASTYWADPARIDQAAVPGVVRMEWTGPEHNRIYVQRRNPGRTITG